MVAFLSATAHKQQLEAAVKRSRLAASRPAPTAITLAAEKQFGKVRLGATCSSCLVTCRAATVCCKLTIVCTLIGKWPVMRTLLCNAYFCCRGHLKCMRCSSDELFMQPNQNNNNPHYALLWGAV